MRQAKSSLPKKSDLLLLAVSLAHPVFNLLPPSLEALGVFELWYG